MSNILELALSQLAVHSITAAIPQQKLVKTFPHSTNIWGNLDPISHFPITQLSFQAEKLEIDF